jgi:predicted nuclease of predicted toxin-antitoxin system
MRFLADIPIARSTARRLAELGHDCALARERLLPAAADRAILELAASERRVVLTFDLDFGAIVALSGRDAPSVITLRTLRHHPLYVEELLARVLPRIEPELARGALVTITDTHVRVRSLPIVRETNE